MQPHAGAQTNMAVYFSCLEPGDTILGLRLDHGGHLTHGLKVNFSGRLYTIAGYGVDRETNLVDFDEVGRIAKECKPKLIICGGSAYPRRIEADRFREIADEVGALLLCDMAHFAASLPRASIRTRRPIAISSRRLRTRPWQGLGPASSSARRSTPRRSTRLCFRACRAGRSATRSPRRRRASRSPARRRSAPTRPRCGATRTRSPTR